MKINGCGGCGNCADFLNEMKCPTGAFGESKGSGYTTMEIDKRLCINCGLCLSEIDCLCDAIQED